MRVSDVASINDPASHLIIEDRLYFSRELVAEFLARARARKVTARCALPSGPFSRYAAVPLQGVPFIDGSYAYELRYEPGAAARRMPVNIVIGAEQGSESLTGARRMQPMPEPRLPISERALIRVDHWANLWAANLAALAVGAARARKAKWRLLRLALKARSLNQWNVLRASNVVAPECDIHPTAYIEDSRIGRGTRIGAGAVVRGSWIGDNCHILNRATVERSVLGDGAQVTNGCTAQFAVLYPGHLTMSNRVSFSLCGRDSVLGDGATLETFRIDSEPVQVLKGAAAVQSGLPFLGSCLGHGAYLGAGCVLGPGRTIPNGWRIGREPGAVTAVPDDFDLQGLQVIRPSLEMQRYA